jgi:origin recognition complex subunit 5
LDGSIEPSNARALCRLAEPHIKQVLAEVHLREDGLTFQPKTNDGATTGSIRPSRLSVELPFYSKFLLISAFLASYNPAKSDKKFFVLNSGRIKKRKNPVAVRFGFFSSITIF